MCMRRLAGIVSVAQAGSLARALELGQVAFVNDPMRTFPGSAQLALR